MKTKLFLTLLFLICLNLLRSQTTISSTHTTLCVGESATLTANHDWLHNWCRWSTNDQVVTDFIVVSPTITSVYTATCVDVHLDPSYASYTQTVAICLGIKKELRNTLIQVYPNPTTESITIEGMEKNTSIEIYNAVGAICFSNTYSTEKSKIILKDYPTGIYFIKIKLGAQEFTKKIIKQ